MRYFMFVGIVLLVACEGDLGDSKEQRRFENCIYRAQPASGEAITACKDAAKEIQ